MKKRTLAGLIVICGAIAIALAIAEIGLRLRMHRDEDGNCMFHSTRLRPFHPAVKRAEKIIARYQASTNSDLIYDAELGWTLRPLVDNHNKAGFVTTSPEVSVEKSSDRLRIALFGGSYTMGVFDKGWWRVLEESLNSAGIKAEVLNFGVSGFGMDQAYLRWKRDGVPYHADLVIFGFVGGNCLDNENMMHMVKDPETSIPFTKPKFILDGAGGVKLVNSPTPSPEQIPEIMRHLDSWPPIQHEYFYAPDDFKMKPWRLSKLAAFIEGKMVNPRSEGALWDFYALQKEPAQVALGITKQFANEVTASGSLFWIAHLPHHTDLEQLQAHGKFQFQDLLDAVDKIAPTIHTEHALLEACGNRPIEASYVEGHYKPELHAAVGHEIAAYIQKNLPGKLRPESGPK